MRRLTGRSVLSALLNGCFRDEGPLLPAALVSGRSELSSRCGHGERPPGERGGWARAVADRSCFRRPSTWRRSSWWASRCWAAPSPARCGRSSQVSRAGGSRERVLRALGPWRDAKPPSPRAASQAAAETRGRTGAQSWAASSLSGISLQEAQQILNVSTLSPEEIQKVSRLPGPGIAAGAGAGSGREGSRAAVPARRRGWETKGRVAESDPALSPFLR